jgi:hypothetical protein
MPPCASSASVIVGLASDRIGAGATSPFRYIAHHLIENTLLVSSSHTPYLPTLFSPALCVPSLPLRAEKGTPGTRTQCRGQLLSNPANPSTEQQCYL